MRRPGVVFVAEKVENAEVLAHCQSLGFDLFQGFFFSKPEVLTQKTIKGNKLQYLRLLAGIQAVELDLGGLEESLKRDLSLSYKLLRFINSVHFGWKAEIRSLRHAMVLMGDREFRKWASLVVLMDMASDKPLELVLNALIRARWCELLAPNLGIAQRAPDLFFLGLFSRLDAILDAPFEKSLKNLPLETEVSQALLGVENRFHAVLVTIEAYEKGETDRFSSYSRKLGLQEGAVQSLYWKAVEWSEQSLKQEVA